jgi:hypothetical protein
MRFTVSLGAAAILFAGCAAGDRAAAPQHMPAGAAGTFTAQEAVGLLGAPTYERQCEDGSKTLGWKHEAAAQTTAPGPGRFVVLYSPAEGEPKEMLVCKFDTNGRLIWWREVR